MVEKFVPKELNITENAVLKVKNLIAEENKKNLHLRVFVTGGGCSGFQYGFKLDDNAEDDDTVLKEDEVSVLIDSLSIQYLFGSLPRDCQRSRWLGSIDCDIWIEGEKTMEMQMINICS